MDDKQRCQSCAMPLGEGFYGTNTDGSENQEYCKYCYADGKFTYPDMTLQQAVDASVEYMSKNLNFPEEQAMKISTDVIPNLKRWKK